MFVPLLKRSQANLTDRMAELKMVVSMLLTVNFGCAGTLWIGKVLSRSIDRELTGLLQ